MFWVYVVLVFQSFLYALLYNYLGCVFPGPGGLKRPIFFFLDVSTRQKSMKYRSRVGYAFRYLVSDFLVII